MMLMMMMMSQDKLLFLLLLVLASVAMAPGLATTKPQLLANPTYACALRSTGQVDCWGHSSSGYSVAAPTNQQFWSISSGAWFTCGLGYDGHVQCWGETAMSYTGYAQSVVVRGYNMCVRTPQDLKWDCMGLVQSMEYSFSQVALGQSEACGILAESGHPFCWSMEVSTSMFQTYEAVVLSQIVISDSRTCGIEQGSGAIWCRDSQECDTSDCNLGVTPSLPALPFMAQFVPGSLVSHGDDFCALVADHTAWCWGVSYPQGALPISASSSFVQLTHGGGFACGLQADGAPLCWGNDAERGVMSPPAGVRFALLAASNDYVCGMRSDDEVTVCWGNGAPANPPCPTACFGAGTLNTAECRCECPVVYESNTPQDCTCLAGACKNGGRVQNDGACSCQCSNVCPGMGCVRGADCSCSCPVTSPHPNLASAVPDSPPELALTYRIAGGDSTLAVKRRTGKITIAGADECADALFYLDLAHTAASWSPASCNDSGDLFMGANMANLDINQHPLATVRLSGDRGGGWLYRIVKCVPATNTLVLCPRNWKMNTLHCPGPNRDCSRCLPLGRGEGSAAAASYLSTCTRAPAPAAATQLSSMILAGSYSGYYAEPSGSRWRLPLPRGVTCASRFRMFSAQEWPVELGAAVVKLYGADANGGDWQYVDGGCDDATTSLLLQPYQWTVSPTHCPDLDCSSCLMSSPPGACAPTLMAPYGLQATSVGTGSDTSVSLTWRDPGAPPGTNYAVYIRNSNGLPLRYTTSSQQLQIFLAGTGLGLRLQAKVVRVYCTTTCPVGGCVANSFAGVQLARSGVEREECDGVVDCMGACNGTALLNPCGVCALPADYYKGKDYWVDCANTCGGSAYIGECGVCVGGRSGLTPNAHKDCQGTCFGKATRDDCGVCHAEGDDHSSRDCAGVCGGKAVVDECGQCALGTTGREFNTDMDCSGQCFGQRLPTDPACQCEREELDDCFVCGGDNSTCAGCDGVPNSGAVRDLCGVCGGDNSTCCFLPFAQATVLIRDFQAIAARTTLDAGETLLVQNLHESRPAGYTVVLERLDFDRNEVSFVSSSKLKPGHSLSVELARPGKYRLTTVESNVVSTELTVRYNAKTTDACGRCIDRGLLAHATAYEHCCAVMDSNNVHAWFATTTYYHRDATPARVVQRSENYRSAPARHLLRLVKPQMVDTSVWSATDQRLAVGDLVVLENRDLLDHVIAITGPHPVPDVVLDRGTVAVVGPLLTPGIYRVESRSNLINTTFTVEFAFACTVHVTHDDDDEQPQPAWSWLPLFT